MWQVIHYGDDVADHFILKALALHAIMRRGMVHAC